MENLITNLTSTTYMYENVSAENFTLDDVKNVPIEVIPHWKLVLDKIATVVMTINTICMMLGMGAATDWRAVKNNFWPPIGVVIGMCGQFLALPLLGFGLSILFKLKPYEALGVLIISCSPGGSLSNFLTFWMDGDIALSIVMTTCSSIVAFGGMPLNLWIYTRYWVNDDNSHMKMPFLNIFISLLFIMIPVLIGMIIKHFKETFAKMVTKVTSIIGFVGMGVVMIIWLFVYYDVFARATVAIIFAALLLPACGFTAAYIIAKICCRTHKVCRTIGIETGSQNMPVALSIILLSFTEPSIKGQMIIFPTMYGILLMVEAFSAVGLFQAYKRKCVKKEKDSFQMENKADDEKASVEEKLKLNA